MNNQNDDIKIVEIKVENDICNVKFIKPIKQITITTTIQKNNDNETIKCSLFDDITECNFNHPCDDCSRLIRHEEL